MKILTDNELSIAACRLSPKEGLLLAAGCLIGGAAVHCYYNHRVNNFFMMSSGVLVGGFIVHLHYQYQQNKSKGFFKVIADESYNLLWVFNNNVITPVSKGLYHIIAD